MKHNNDLLAHVERTFYNNEGLVDHRKLEEKLHLKVKTIVHAIGKSARALQINPFSAPIQRELRKIAYLYFLLKKLLPSDSEIKIWLNAPNPEYDGMTPVDILEAGKIDELIDYLHEAEKGALS